jgi:hypothetical protein
MVPEKPPIRGIVSIRERSPADKAMSGYAGGKASDPSPFRLIASSGLDQGASPMNRRRAVPRFELMEDRMVPSQVGGHLAHSVSLELHRLGRNVSKTYHAIQHDIQAHNTAHHSAHANNSTQTQSGFQGFWNSIKSAFKF